MKGDFVNVTTAVGGIVTTLQLNASKAGRTVHVKYGTKWLDITERTRPTAANREGRAVGNALRFRLEAVVAVEVRRADDDAAEPRRVAASEPLGL